MEFLICYRIINAHPGQAVQAICSVDINGDPHIVSASDSEIRIWDQKKTKAPLMRISKKEDGSVFPEPLLSLSCWIDREESEACLWIAAAGGGRDNALVVWKVDPAKMPEAESVECFKHFALHEDDVKSLAVSPDHTRLVSGSWDNKVRVLDVKEKREDKALTERHVSRINGVAFSDDGRYIASASNDDTIIIWDWRQDDRYRRLAGHYRDVNSVRFKKIDGGQYLISGGDDGQLILWHLEEIWQHPGPLVKDDELDVSRMDFNTEINCLQFAPDGKSIAAGNQSGEVCLLDLEAGKLREGARFDNTHFLLVHGCRFAGLHPESDLLKKEEDKHLLRQYGAIIPEHEDDEQDAERWRRVICKLSGEILREEVIR
jgi:WD40 repeat protein